MNRPGEREQDQGSGGARRAADSVGRSSRTLKSLALLTALSAFYLLVAGAHVNAYQAALSVPDWPLSYGRILAPEWPGNIFYEQHHRATAATTMLLFVATAVLLWRGRAPEGARRAAGWAGAILALQVVMGGLIVLRLNPPWLGALHVVVAVATVVAISTMALRVWSNGRADSAGKSDPALATVRSRTRASLWLLLLAVSLGSVTRHPPAGDLLFVTTLTAHLFVALLLLLWLSLLALSILRANGSRSLRRWGGFLLLGVMLQLVVGGFVFVISPKPFDEVYPPPVGFPNLHAAHIVLAAFVATCLIAVLLRSGGARAKAPRPRVR